MGLLKLLFRVATKKPRRRSLRTNVAYASKKTRKQSSVPHPNANYKAASVDAVIDGDTVIVSTEFRTLNLRLDSIDCPEQDQPWGDIAKAGLIKLIGGQSIYIEEHGIDRYERILATIFVYDEGGGNWINVNEKMVVRGHAWVMRQFYNHLPSERRRSLNNVERWAKSKRVGLWKTSNPVPPWEWRGTNQ
jgi:micrococcal nuclease